MLGPNCASQCNKYSHLLAQPILRRWLRHFHRLRWSWLFPRRFPRRTRSISPLFSSRVVNSVCDSPAFFTKLINEDQREREIGCIKNLKKKNQIVKVFLQWICRSRGSLWWRLLRRKRRRLVVAALSVWFLRRFEQRAVALLHRPPFFSNGIALSLSLSVAAGIQLKDSGLRAFFFFFR